jgi:hypothetical protein
MHTTIYFPAQTPIECDVPPPAADSRFEARRWLDEQFKQFECEPLRESGKVLIADKVLAVALAAGAQRLRSDLTYQQAFATAACHALDKPRVVIDLRDNSVTY